MTWWLLVRRLLRILGILVLAAAAAFNAFIYNYHKFQPDLCAWNQPDSATAATDQPIHLIAFGDPQIRGAGTNAPWRTKLDLYGNDYYLGHIYRTLITSLKPNHVAIMGDLVSSQWISDDQFYERVERYRTRIFDPALLPQGAEIINITGNHDIGYAGEVTHGRMARYEKAFGKVNFMKIYNHEPSHPAYRIVVLNSLVLDGPMANFQYSEQAWQFLEHEVANSDFKGPTVLLTHVPLYKAEGICQDGPYFTFYDESYGNALREQNHLTEETSQRVLNLVFGPGNPYGGVILTGHDHEGCESIYVYDDETQLWSAQKPQSVDKTSKSVREITVRSMMGEFGGNAGLLRGSYDSDSGAWIFNYTLCPFGVQHWWWASKVLAIIAVGIAMPVLSAMWLGFV